MIVSVRNIQRFRGRGRSGGGVVLVVSVVARLLEVEAEDVDVAAECLPEDGLGVSWGGGGEEAVGEDVVEAAGLVPGPARGLQLLHPPPGGLAEHQPGLGLVIELVAVNV